MCNLPLTYCIRNKTSYPWKKSYDKLRQHIKKKRHHVAQKSSYSQSYGFSVVMYGCESWTIKKAECQRIDAFELWRWRILLRVTWTVGSNQSNQWKLTLNIHWKDWCWYWSSKNLATWCKEMTHWKRSWCWERLRAGGEWSDRGWVGYIATPSQWIWIWENSGR